MEKLIWRLFIALLLVIGVMLLFLPFGIQLMWVFPVNLVVLGLPVLMLVAHAIYRLGTARGFLLIGLSAFLGWLMETIGLTGGTFFGGQYVYSGETLKLGIVPIAVVFYWAVFIYTGYAIANTLLTWRGKQKPSIRNGSWPKLLLFILLDGWLVTAIDLFMDPILVFEGRWMWLNGGPYFGVPIGNFVGWFIVTVMVTGLFRLFEYFWPQEERGSSRVDLIPLLGYFLLLVSFCVSALEHGLFALLVPGIASMLPLPALSTYYLLFAVVDHPHHTKLVSE